MIIFPELTRIRRVLYFNPLQYYRKNSLTPLTLVIPHQGFSFFGTAPRPFPPTPGAIQDAAATPPLRSAVAVQSEALGYRASCPDTEHFLYNNPTFSIKLTGPGIGALPDGQAYVTTLSQKAL